MAPGLVFGGSLLELVNLLQSSLGPIGDLLSPGVRVVLDLLLPVRECLQALLDLVAQFELTGGDSLKGVRASCLDLLNLILEGDLLLLATFLDCLLLKLELEQSLGALFAEFVSLLVACCPLELSLSPKPFLAALSGLSAEACLFDPC